MLRGLYTAATGMISESVRTDVIANNVANVNTSGYKKDDAISAEFEAILLKRINDGQEVPVIGGLGRGARVDEIATIHEQGSVRQTGNTYDLSISGNGFFVIETPQGPRYSRNGSFTRSAAGELATVNGMRVLDQNGLPINVPDGGRISIGAKGELAVGNQPVTTLGFVDFADRQSLLKVGDSLFAPQQGQRPLEAPGSIMQGTLENSNVNAVSEMIHLINAYRAYESNSKAVVTQDKMLEKAVNEVGKV